MIVEAGRIELPSETEGWQTSTRLVIRLKSYPTLYQRQKSGRTSLLRSYSKFAGTFGASLCK